MLKDFWRLVDNNKSNFFGLMGMQAAFAAFASNSSFSFGMQLFVTAFISQFVVIAVLYGFKFPGRGKFVSRSLKVKYSLKFMALYGLTEVLAFVLVLYLLPTLGKNIGALTFAALIALCVTRPPIVALAGTWLPADLVGHKMSLGRAIARGAKRFWSSYFNVLSITVMEVVLTFAIIYLTGLAAGLFVFRETDVALIVVAPMLIGMFSFIANAYISVLVTRRFMEAENFTDLRDITNNAGVLLPHAGL